MAITRINQFRATPANGAALRDFLDSVMICIRDAPGCHSCQLLRHHDDATQYAIIEVWENIASHQASVSRIPPELMQQARTLFAAPAQGAYWEPVRPGAE